MTKQKKSTFRVLFYLKRNNPNKNGLVPIMGRITIDGKIAQFSTKLECDPKQWDLKFGRITGRSDEAIRLNERLMGIRTQIDKHYYTMLREEGFTSADKVKCAFLGINISSNMLLKLFAEQNAVMAQMVEAKTRSRSTLRNLTTVYNHLKKYITLKYKREDIAFREIDEKFVRGFELYLRTETKHKCCNNTAYLYVILLNQIMIDAIDRKLINENVVSKYILEEMQKEEVEREYLIKSSIEHLATTPLTFKTDELVRDLYLFVCFTGLAYTDLATLCRTDIVEYSDGSFWIVKPRGKSSIIARIKLLDIPLRIMEKYKGLAEGNLVFPVPNYSTYWVALRRIMKQVGFNNTLTSHTARHTFATLLLTEGASIESVSKMLGHNNIKTTQIYAKITDEKISRDMDAAALKLKGLEQSISVAI